MRMQLTEPAATQASVIPQREAWLFSNEQAKALVAAGLKQALIGRFSDSPPDLEAVNDLATQLED